MSRLWISKPFSDAPASWCRNNGVLTPSSLPVKRGETSAQPKRPRQTRVGGKRDNGADLAVGVVHGSRDGRYL